MNRPLAYIRSWFVLTLLILAGCKTYSPSPYVSPQVGWDSVTLAFERARYERFVASSTVAQATNAANGEPVVHAGDILLARLSK